MTIRQVTIPVLIVITALLGGCGDKEQSDGPRSETAAAFCDEHQIAEAQCPFCHPELVESLGFCEGHQVAEALCYQCNPALVPAFKAVGDWCAGHDRPESQCTLCNPGILPGSGKSQGASQTGVSPSRRESVPEGLFLTRRPPETRHQRPPRVSCETQNLLVRFSSAEIERQIDLRLEPVSVHPITRTLECNAVVAYDGNHYAHLAPQVPGILEDVRCDLGDHVAAGDTLAMITSSHLGAAKAAYLQALAALALWEQNHERESRLYERGVSTEREVLEVQTHLSESRIALAAAQQELISLGLTAQQIEEVRNTEDTSATYAVRAAFDGVVVERNAAPGEVVDPSKPLFSVADVSSMWAILDVYEDDVRELQLGQPVVLRVEGLKGESFGGRITWVSSAVDPQTRTLRARAEFDNEAGLLRANMFARAEVSVRDRHEALVVPGEAVQWEGCCNVVFVRKSATVYEPRKVHLGTSTGRYHEVLSGLSPGEQVVTQGSFLLKTEILKGNIGAGCCEVQPGA